MTKACFLLLADREPTRRWAGWPTHSPARRSSSTLADAVVIFDGASTRWVPELEAEDHRYHRVYCELQDHIAGACSYWATAFGVKDQIEASSVKLLSDYRRHPSLHGLVSQGYQVITF
ncbi:MAG: hypothetical protein ABI323_12580 [Solirubrobacteraceae bacterium]